MILNAKNADAKERARLIEQVIIHLTSRQEESATAARGPFKQMSEKMEKTKKGASRDGTS